MTASADQSDNASGAFGRRVFGRRVFGRRGGAGDGGDNSAGAIAAAPGPQGWAFALFLLFGGAQLIAGLVFFFAYNWRELADPVKIALPQIAMATGFLGWAVLGRESRLGALLGVLAMMMIGVSMAVVGQVYQLGADPWRLFAVWAAFAAPIAILARSDAIFAIAFFVATTAYGLYTDELTAGAPDLRPMILAFYVAAAAACVMARDLVAGGAPAWLRWLLVFATLAPATAGGLGDIVEGPTLLDSGGAASLALFAAAGGLFAFYRQVRADKPAQAMAMFAIAVYVGALGVKWLIKLANFDSAGLASFIFILCALWVIAVTGALAWGLKHLKGGDA